jgi:Ribonuclease G/E
VTDASGERLWIRELERMTAERDSLRARVEELEKADGYTLVIEAKALTRERDEARSRLSSLEKAAQAVLDAGNAPLPQLRAIDALRAALGEKS